MARINELTEEGDTTADVALVVNRHAFDLQGRIINAEAELEGLRAAYDAAGRANEVLKDWLPDNDA